MEKHASRSSVISTALKGGLYMGFTGALMAGIFLGVSALAAALTAGALGSVATLGVAAGTMLLVGVSTGTFGALIQGFSALNKQKSFEMAAYSPTNGRDIAITAVSNNLYSPKLQAALDHVNQQTPSAMPDQAPAAETTHFRDRVGQHTSLTEALNRRLTGNTAGQSHTSRIEQEREAQQLAPSSRTLQ